MAGRRAPGRRVVGPVLGVELAAGERRLVMGGELDRGDIGLGETGEPGRKGGELPGVCVPKDRLRAEISMERMVTDEPHRPVPTTKRAAAATTTTVMAPRRRSTT